MHLRRRGLGREGGEGVGNCCWVVEVGEDAEVGEEGSARSRWGREGRRRTPMGPLRLIGHHLVGCPCLSLYSRRWGVALGPCLQRLGHAAAQAGVMEPPPPSSLGWRGTDYEGSYFDEESIGRLHQPYWVTKEKLQFREEEKENLVTEVLGLGEELSVKEVLSGWVKKVGSRSSKAVLQESSGENSMFTAKYVPYEQVARTVNAVMKELGQRGHPEAALQVFQWMQLQGWCRLDPHLYTTVIDTLGRSGCLELAEKIFADMETSQVKKDTVLYNALLHARSKAGQVEAVLELFHAMKEINFRDLVTFNTVMNMYVKAGLGLAKVLSVFKEMCLQGIRPDSVSYDILLAACASGDHGKEAQRIYEAMKKRGIKRTVVTFTSLITVYANAGDFRAALQIFSEMVKEKCNPNVKTFTSLINACGRGGDIEEGQTIFESMKDFGVEPNVMTYNALIALYSKQGEQKLAQRTFLRMVQAGLQPTGVSLTVLMSSFKAAGAYKEALTIYEQAKQSTTACNVQTYTEALDVCVKSKSIAGMLKVMEDMRIAGCSPNAVTCSVVLIALSSKCSGIGEALQLIESLEGFDSKLVLCCQRLLAEVTKTDRQVAMLLDELFRPIDRGDVRTWTVLSSSLLDALWALGWYRRSALVLAWAIDSGLYDGLCVLSFLEWKLDVRRLSSGGAVVAFYQWLTHLLQAAQKVDLMTYDLLGGESSTPESSNSITESTSVGDIGDDTSKAGTRLKAEVLVPFLLLNISESNSDSSEVFSGDRQRKESPFPRYVTVVTGWGKLSKEEGRSKVKTGVEKEIAKLGVPFRLSDDTGRWTAKGEALLRWLLRPETAGRLVLWDAAAETSC